MPDGKILPCCVSPYTNGSGNLNTTSINDLINSKLLKGIRKEMMKGIRPANCIKCFELEDAGVKSLREHMNQEFKEQIPVLEKTNKDGTIEDFKLKYLDIRFSNICNFKCRGCSPALSTSWIKDHEKLHPLKSLFHKKTFTHIDKNSPLFSDIISHIPHLKKVYFAGGEPLLMDEHYWLLEELIKHKRTDIKLAYNSNLSILKTDRNNLLSTWQQFEDIEMNVSIDDIHEQGEYFREGLVFQKLMENISQIRETLPHIKLNVTCTINIFNIERLVEIHEYLLQKEIINLHSFHFNTLLTPAYYRTQVLPEKLKEEVKAKLELYIQKTIKTFGKDAHEFCEQIENQIKFMFQDDKSRYIPFFLKRTKQLDKLRNRSFESVHGNLYSGLINNKS